MNIFLAQSLGDLIYKTFVVKDRYKLFITGLSNTLLLAVGACILGIIVGVIVTTARMTPRKGIFSHFFGKLADLYVTFIRGTPVLVQLFILYFVVLIPFKGIWNGMLVGIVAFGLNSGGYMSEILRGGINAVDKGQMEAGRSLGFTWKESMALFVLPQGIKNSVPSIFNELIMLVKETSIVGMIGIVDLMKASDMISTQIMNFVVPLGTITILYLVIVLGLEKVQKKLERRLGKGDRN